MSFVILQDLQKRIQKHTEVETVDLVLKLKDKLVCKDDSWSITLPLLPLLKPPVLLLLNYGSATSTTANSPVAFLFSCIVNRW